MRNRHCGNTDIFPDHNRACTLVEYDFGDLVWGHLHIFQGGDKSRDVGTIGLKHLHLNRAAVNCPCHICPKLCVDGIGQAGTRGEIRSVEEHANMLAPVKLKAYLSLDEGAIGNLPHRGMVLLDATAGFSTGCKAANGYWPLRYRIDLA